MSRISIKIYVITNYFNGRVSVAKPPRLFVFQKCPNINRVKLDPKKSMNNIMALLVEDVYCVNMCEWGCGRPCVYVC